MSRVGLAGKVASETVSEIFDFTSRLAVGETISTAAVSATVYSGTDGSPAAIISGSASISGAKVTQKVTGGSVGNVYLLKCQITTSTSQTLALSAFLPILPDYA